jgi:glycosyltransferase involved in cell wall biosynthesis
MPAKSSDKVISITNAWKNKLHKVGVESIMIPAGIDISKYNKDIDYSNMTFGRMTRYSGGKVHPEWNRIANEVLQELPGSKCIMMSNNYRNAPKNERFIIERDIKINEIDKKIERLSRLTMFPIMQNVFTETFSLCLLEAMASGLCIVLYSKVAQPAMIEVLGKTGIVVNNPYEFKKKIIDLLPNADKKAEWGQKAKERAKQYTIDRMINAYNKVFKEVLIK